MKQGKKVDCHLGCDHWQDEMVGDMIKVYVWVWKSSEGTLKCVPEMLLTSENVILNPLEAER